MNDAVLIYDGPDGNNFITDYCGKSGWDDVPSTAEELTVVFKSNENVITRLDAEFCYFLGSFEKSSDTHRTYSLLPQ